MVRFVPSAMSTNPNTKTYSRRVARMARKLESRLSSKYNDQSVTEILAKTDPKATPTMHREAVKMAIEDCSKSERSYLEEADQHRKARETLQEFRKTTPFQVIDGGGAATIRHRWPAVVE